MFIRRTDVFLTPSPLELVNFIYIFSFSAFYIQLPTHKNDPSFLFIFIFFFAAISEFADSLFSLAKLSNVSSLTDSC